MPIDLSTTETYPALTGPQTGDPPTPAALRSHLSGLGSRTRWIWARLQNLIGQFCPIGVDTPGAVAFSATSDTVTLANHGLVLDDEIAFVPVTGASLPAPLVFGTSYYARDVTTDTLKVAATQGGAAIDITGASIGAVYVLRRSAPLLSAYAKLSALASTVGLASGARLIGLETLGTGHPAQTLLSFAQWVVDHCITIADLADTVAGGDAMVGVPAYDGASFDIAVGTLQTFLRLLADKAGKLDGPNSWTAKNTYYGGVELASGAYLARARATVPTNAAAVSMSVGVAPRFESIAWVGNGSDLLTITLVDYTGEDEPEMSFEFSSTTASTNGEIKFLDPSGTRARIQWTGNGVGTFRFQWHKASTGPVTGWWRYTGPGMLAKESGTITIVYLNAR